MAAHSSVFAWRIPGTGELGGLPSMGSHRVGHDWSDLAAAEEERSIIFTTTTRRIKYLGINLPKEMKDLYTENYKTLMK